MGLTDEFFWNLTLPLFGKLLERHKARERQADRRAGEIAVATYNVNRKIEEYPEPWDWTDVFPEHHEPKEPQTEEQMLMVMNMMAARTKGMA